MSSCVTLALALVVPLTTADGSEPRRSGGRLVPCSADPFEPNDTLSAAAVLPDGRWSGPSVCPGDDDWYRLSAGPGGITEIGIIFDNDQGDLDLLAYDAAGQFLAGRVGQESYSGLFRSFETGEEFLSALSLTTDLTYFARARGATDLSANPYLLQLEWIPYADGASCSDLFDPADCEGRGGDDGGVRLYQFPWPDADDGHVGAGYVYDTASNYLWARREVIMAIRHALHEVQLRFPDTSPLGIIDISQRDGITPGYDIGVPRHPPVTHDQGGSIDVAYYQTADDNHARIVCDPTGSAHDGAYCTDVDEHIVDIPRTAYFLAILARHERFRVAGVDRLIGPLIHDGVAELVAQGVLTAQDRLTLQSKIAYGPGWPYHHHHIHVSFAWWPGKRPVQPVAAGCGFRMAADRPRPEARRP